MSNYLFDAARRGDAESLKSILLGKYGEVNAQEISHGLLKAAKNGQSECVKILLGAKAFPDIEDNDKCNSTPLELAVYYGHIGVAKQLIEAGALVNKANSVHLTPLYVAISNDDFDMVKLLLASGCRKAIEVSEDEEDIAEELPLPMAASKDNYAITELLLQYHEDVNLRTTSVQAALHHASTNGNVEIVKLLLNYGAHVDSISLEEAFIQNYTHLTKVLVEHSRDENMVRVSKDRALCEAASMRDKCAMTTLFEADTDPNCVDEFGHTPVLSATIHCDVDTVQLLIKYGCNVDMEGESFLPVSKSIVCPIYVAVWNKHVQLASMFYVASLKTQKQIKSILSCNELKTSIADHGAINTWLKDTFSNPPSLLHICRQNIRGRVLPKQARGVSRLPHTVSKLAIPKLLQDYLVMEI